MTPGIKWFPVSVFRLYLQYRHRASLFLLGVNFVPRKRRRGTSAILGKCGQGTRRSQGGPIDAPEPSAPHPPGPRYTAIAAAGPGRHHSLSQSAASALGRNPSNWAWSGPSFGFPVKFEEYGEGRHPLLPVTQDGEFAPDSGSNSPCARARCRARAYDIIEAAQGFLNLSATRKS